MRRGVVNRVTTETSIALRLELDGRGRYDVSTGIRFFDHMLELVTRHGGFDLKIAAKGDLDVDQHHTVEDVGIALGEAVSMALGNRRGINRAGYFVMPMDETLGVAAIDLSGRVHAVVDLQIEVERVGDLQSELVTDFFEGFAQGARANVHVKVLYGRSSHHQVEALFKAFARALRFACSRDRQLANARCRARKGLSVLIALIDYGAGNLTSVRKGFAAVGAELATPRTPADLAGAPRDRRARRRAFPGDDAARRRMAGRDPATRWKAGPPLFGICLGLQWLFESSTEADDVPGLGLMSGRCERLPSIVKVPHVGWNALAMTRAVAAARRRIPDGAQVYFTHSYAAPVTADCVAADHARPAVRRRRRARPRLRRPVPPGEVGRHRPAGHPQFPDVA